MHDDEVQPEDTTKKHRTIHTKDDDDDDASYEDVQDTASVEEETGVYKHPQACGKPVCRGCSVE